MLDRNKLGNGSPKDLMSPNRIEAALRKSGSRATLGSPVILDKPDDPQVVEVRLKDVSDSRTMTIKAIETRDETRFIGERIEGDLVVRQYHREQVRAVNVFRLWQDGSLELRIASQKNSSQYAEPLKRAWHTVRLFLNEGDFSSFPIMRTKNHLWSEREDLGLEVRYTTSSLRNSLGTVLSAATGGSDVNLSEDDAASDSLDGFLSAGAYCDELNLWWRGRAERSMVSAGADPGGPEETIHVLFTRENNEFVITQRCSEHDYEWIYKRVRELNG